MQSLLAKGKERQRRQIRLIPLARSRTRSRPSLTFGPSRGDPVWTAAPPAASPLPSHCAPLFSGSFVYRRFCTTPLRWPIWMVELKAVRVSKGHRSSALQEGKTRNGTSLLFSPFNISDSRSLGRRTLSEVRDVDLLLSRGGRKENRSTQVGLGYCVVVVGERGGGEGGVKLGE